MILDFNRKPLFVRIQRWAARHRPRFKDTVKFQAKVIVQVRSVVLLDHEPPMQGGSDARLSSRLSGFRKIALLPVG
jgi:hypothetical protein